ncbi:MAG: hypothetical protein IPP91_16915 [Betaproteobacteria bacterium]|nr:hypothetical protein [Betaproteobacteria bacterium]
MDSRKNDASMHIPLGTLTFREGVEFGFPSNLCCNCGANERLRVIPQDTRRSSYLIAGGTETTFQLPLPFCPRCTASAKRRPKNVVHRLLLLALLFAVYFAALVLLGEIGIAPPLVAKYLAPGAASLAVFTTLTVMLRARPSRGQSSYFQPVRIPTLKREFVSGTVTAIGFSFTNSAYARAFKQANMDAIARKQLFVDGA